MTLCNVCDAPLGAPVYRSQGETSVTSLCQIVPGRTVVHFCDRCGHLSTEPVLDPAAFYATDYKIMLESEDEDMLYAVVGDRRIYRTDHQIDTMLGKVRLAEGARVLDYGCAKGQLMRKLLSRRADVAAHLFDVSDMYRPFWAEFLAEDRVSTFTPSPAWDGTFDLVSSSFSLEHMARPAEAVSAFTRLLRPGGVVYGLVPDAYANVGDFVVVDHSNHFSPASLAHLCHANGLEVVDIDATIHQSALVFVARKPDGDTAKDDARFADVGATRAKAEAIAAQWAGYGAKVAGLEKQADGRKAAIYGSGFYGTLLAASLADASHVSCFVDRDPFRQTKTLLGKPVLAPEATPLDVAAVYVGLNPAIARAAMAGVEAWKGRGYTYLFP